jgi:hypothetical protein
MKNARKLDQVTETKFMLTKLTAILNNLNIAFIAANIALRDHKLTDSTYH